MTTRSPSSPPRNGASKPDLFNLHGEETYDALRAAKRTVAKEEYHSLYCAAFYQHSLIAEFREAVLANSDSDSAAGQWFVKLVRTWEASVDILTNRLTLIRIREGDLGQEDPAVPDLLRSRIYGDCEVRKAGASTAATWLQEFLDARDKQRVKQAAIRSAGGLRDRRPAGPDKDKDRKGKEKI